VELGEEEERRRSGSGKCGESHNGENLTSSNLTFFSFFSLLSSGLCLCHCYILESLDFFVFYFFPSYSIFTPRLPLTIIPPPLVRTGLSYSYEKVQGQTAPFPTFASFDQVEPLAKSWS
jgi:hypothetical protein